jgi:hypothetical protein
MVLASRDIKEKTRTCFNIRKVQTLKMPFTLTKEHVLSIVGPTEQAEWTSFLDAMDPNVHWVVADPVHDATSLSGTYASLQSPSQPHKSNQSRRMSNDGWMESAALFDPD